MKKNWVISTTLFLGFFSFYYLGCQKTDHPFGIYAPNGLDVPTATFTPVTGAILAGVIDNNLPKAGVTVTATDPFANVMTSVTDSFGLAAFNPAVLNLGVWTIEVPTQGRYYQSSIPLTVTGSNDSVTFRAGNQTLSATPVTPQTYGSSNTSIAYNLIYDQPYNLNVPVVLSTNSGLPAPWTKTFQPVTIGNSVGSSNVTIGKTGCYYQAFSFLFNATDLFGNPIDGKPATISRGFPIPIVIGFSQTCSTQCGGGSWTASAALTLTTTNDCGQSWSINVVSVNSLGTTVLNQTNSFINGGTRAYGFTPGGGFQQNINTIITITSPTGSLSGFCSFKQNVPYSGTPINSSI